MLTPNILWWFFWNENKAVDMIFVPNVVLSFFITMKTLAHLMSGHFYALHSRIQVFHQFVSVACNKAKQNFRCLFYLKHSFLSAHQNPMNLFIIRLTEKFIASTVTVFIITLIVRMSESERETEPSKVASKCSNIKKVLMSIAL